MQLEKILEEIDNLRGLVGGEDNYINMYVKKTWDDCLDMVQDIIRKHMNDGWIPVGERLPEPYRSERSEKCPVGGVDRTQGVDRISLQNAVETIFWMAVWAAEPIRPIDVRMSYTDLKIIRDLIDRERNRRDGERNEVD